MANSNEDKKHWLYVDTLPPMRLYRLLEIVKSARAFNINIELCDKNGTQWFPDLSSGELLNIIGKLRSIAAEWDEKQKLKGEVG